MHGSIQLQPANSVRSRNSCPSSLSRFGAPFLFGHFRALSGIFALAGFSAPLQFRPIRFCSLFFTPASPSAFVAQFIRRVERPPHIGRGGCLRASVPQAPAPHSLFPSSRYCSVYFGLARPGVFSRGSAKLCVQSLPIMSFPPTAMRRPSI